MEELLRTNDPVLISFVESLLREAEITHMVADQNMSIMEGSIGLLPRRVLVHAEEIEAARKLMEEAGVGKELTRERK
jgi:uncharacterized membrane protein